MLWLLPTFSTLYGHDKPDTNQTAQCKCTLYCIALLARHVTADMYWCVYTCSHSIIHNDRKSKWRTLWSLIFLQILLKSWIHHLAIGVKLVLYWMVSLVHLTTQTNIDDGQWLVQVIYTWLSINWVWLWNICAEGVYVLCFFSYICDDIFSEVDANMLYKHYSILVAIAIIDFVWKIDWGYAWRANRKWTPWKPTGDWWCHHWGMQGIWCWSRGAAAVQVSQLWVHYASHSFVPDCLLI